jgi:hypothetical protein
MEWNPQQVLANIRRADTGDLLDRVTAYRQGMDPDAIALIEDELYRRGVTAAAIEDRRQAYLRECLFHSDGAAMMCSFCRLPAVTQGWGWHKLWNKVPLCPRRFRYCKTHQPAIPAAAHPPPPA